MIVDCCSDLHGEFPTLEPGGEVLIVAGDFTASDTEPEYFRFFDWLYEQKHKKKVIVPGNHDTLMEKENYKGPAGVMEGVFDFLCDSGTEFQGMKIWGSPWTAAFPGMNPHCMGYTIIMGCDTDDWLAEHWGMIPPDTDILITHCPPFGVMDRSRNKVRCGSQSLYDIHHKWRIHPRLHVFGHIHEGYGVIERGGTIFVNASHMNGDYECVNPPIRLEI